MRLPLYFLVLLSAASCAAALCAGGPAAANLVFSERLISSDYTYVYGIASGDLDGDGDLDLTTADCTTRGSRKHNDIYWFENDGKGNFKRHSVWSENWAGRFERHRIADLNRDGYPDVVMVDNFHGDLLWFQNPGRPVADKSWTRHVITEGGLLGAYDVDTADVDGDKWLDVGASSWRMGNQFGWYRNPGTKPANEWTSCVIDSNQAETRTIRAGDFNRDGRPDFLGTVVVAGIVLWYENPGPPGTSTWRRHVIDAPARPCHGEPADVDRDGDLDVVMALGFLGDWSVPGSGAQIVWYENMGQPGNGQRWDKHVIWENFSQAFEAIAADLDGDGNLEVVATTRSGQVVWLKHGGDPKGAWAVHPIKQDWKFAAQPIALDVDGDGRLDIAAVNELGLELRWWRNDGPAH